MKNRVYVHGDVSTIICERKDGEVHEVNVSTSDLAMISAINGKWQVSYFGPMKQPYCYSSNGRKGSNVRLLHRFLMGSPDGKVVDHKDGSSLNCIRSNLQVISHGENIAKGKLRSEPSRLNPPITGYRNVYADHGKFRVCVARRYFGIYTTPEEAAEVAAQQRERLNHERWERFVA